MFIDIEQIGNNIKAIRNRKGITLRELSEKSGVHHNTIASLEKTGNSTLYVFLQIAKALEMPPGELLKIKE